MKGDCAPAVALPDESGALPADARHILAGEASLHAERRAGPPLAVEAMADRNANGLAFASDLQLSARAGSLADHLSYESTDDARRIIDHRDDARIIHARRSDDAERADDLLLAVPVGRHDQR